MAPGDHVEEALAQMLELFPDGFAEELRGSAVELVAFTDEAGVRLLEKAFGEVATVPVPSGWEDEWRRFHEPVVVRSLWVGPPWLEPAPGFAVVVIDAGRAFGTGSHATTRLCLELLDDLERGSVLDLGCGSGVLAISAGKLGFEPVIALDSDPAAVDATRRNAALNAVELEPRRADALTAPLPAAEIALANLDLSTLTKLAPRLDCRRLVTSGYYETDVPALPGYRLLERRSREGWAADLFAPE